MSIKNEVLIAEVVPAFKTLGWRVKIGLSAYVFAEQPAAINYEFLEPLVSLREVQAAQAQAETAYAELKDEHDERGIDIDTLSENLVNARARIEKLRGQGNRFVRALRILLKGE